MDPLAVSISDACHLTGVQRTTVYKLLAEGQLEACAVGRRKLVTRRSIDALIERGVEQAKQDRSR